MNHAIIWALNSNLNSTTSFDCGYEHYLPYIYPEHTIIMQNGSTNIKKGVVSLCSQVDATTS